MTVDLTQVSQHALDHYNFAVADLGDTSKGYSEQQRDILKKTMHEFYNNAKDCGEWDEMTRRFFGEEAFNFSHFLRALDPYVMPLHPTVGELKNFGSPMTAYFMMRELDKGTLTEDDYIGGEWMQPEQYVFGKCKLVNSRSKKSPTLTEELTRVVAQQNGCTQKEAKVIIREQFGNMRTNVAKQKALEYLASIWYAKVSGQQLPVVNTNEMPNADAMTRLMWLGFQRCAVLQAVENTINDVELGRLQFSYELARNMLKSVKSAIAVCDSRHDQKAIDDLNRYKQWVEDNVSAVVPEMLKITKEQKKAFAMEALVYAAESGDTELESHLWMHLPPLTQQLAQSVGISERAVDPPDEATANSIICDFVLNYSPAQLKRQAKAEGEPMPDASVIALLYTDTLRLEATCDIRLLCWAYATAPQTREQENELTERVKNAKCNLRNEAIASTHERLQRAVEGLRELLADDYLCSPKHALVDIHDYMSELSGYGESVQKYQQQLKLMRPAIERRLAEVRESDRRRLEKESLKYLRQLQQAKNKREVSTARKCIQRRYELAMAEGFGQDEVPNVFAADAALRALAA